MSETATERSFTPTLHSNTVGGSSAARVMACPASVKLIQKMPERADEESIYAAEGTALHEAVEHCLYEGIDADDAERLAGKTFYGIEITNRHVDDAIVPALRAFDDLLGELEREDGGDIRYTLETQVHLPNIPDAFGTADVIINTPKRVVVLDWKFGAGIPVGATDNKQLQFYARGAAHSAPEFFWYDQNNKYSNRIVELVIVQPRIFDKPSRWQTDYNGLVEFHADLIRALHQAETEKPPYARGDHCKWCRAAPICPAYEELGEAIAALREQMIPEPPHEEIVFTQDDLARWLEMADEIDHFTRAVRALAMEEAKAGFPPTGMKLVQRLANNDWTRPDEEIERMLARRGLKVQDRRRTSLISPTAAKKLLKKLGKKMPEDSYGRAVAGVSLVKEDDPRPAVANEEEKLKEIAANLSDPKE